MTAPSSNLVIIMSDEHQARAIGCAGHPIVQTPNIDKLAAEGIRFEAAYTASPICVPARAAFITGFPIHKTGYWCNAHPYEGKVKGWGHRLQETGHHVISIGKLHYRNEEDPTGFDAQVLPMHVLDGIGDVMGAVRDKLPERHQTKLLSEKIGPGNSSYIKYDQQITANAIHWLINEAPKIDRPWVVYVSLVCPHFPLIAPRKFFDIYPKDIIPAPRDRPKEGVTRHPWIEKQASCQIYDRFFNEETRRIAISSYYGLCSFLDDNIGKIINTLDKTGLKNSTRIIYTSDHGENLGVRGLWGKSNMYEESAAIPLILCGPDVPSGKTVKTAVSLLDAYPTILECVGEQAAIEDMSRPGKSLLRIVDVEDDPKRTIFAEYHAVGAPTGVFLIRKGCYKLIHYVDYDPELFDIESDPLEKKDLASNPKYTSVLNDLQRELSSICNPKEVDNRAKKDQAALVEKHGGRDAVIAAFNNFSGTPAPGQKTVQ